MKKKSAAAKKILAAASASALVLSSGSIAFAEDLGWHEQKDKDLQGIASFIENNWDDAIDLLNGRSETGSKVKATLTFEEAAQSMVSALFGDVDVSWLNSIGLEFNRDLLTEDGTVTGDVLVNDTLITDFNIFVDYLNETEYLQLPQISEAYISEKIRSSDKENSLLNAGDRWTLISNNLENPPAGETLASIINHYGEILHQAAEVGESSQETVSVDGIEQNAYVYTATLSEEDYLAAISEIFADANEDEDIEEVFDGFGNDGYDTIKENSEARESEVTDQIKDNLEELEDEYVATVSVYLDENGNLIGRALDTYKGQHIKLLAPTDGENVGLSLEVTEKSGASWSVTGKGSMGESGFNGNYVVALAGEDSFNVEAQNLTANDGTFHITMVDTEAQNAQAAASETDIEEFDFLSALLGETAVNVSFSRGGGNVEIDAVLTLADVDYISLCIKSEEGESAPEVPDLTNLGKVYSADNKDDMKEYFDNGDWNTIAANLESAGIPTGAAETFAQIMKSSPEESLTSVTTDQTVETEENSETLSEDISTATTVE